MDDFGGLRWVEWWVDSRERVAKKPYCAPKHPFNPSTRGRSVTFAPNMPLCLLNASGSVKYDVAHTCGIARIQRGTHPYARYIARILPPPPPLVPVDWSMDKPRPVVWSQSCHGASVSSRGFGCPPYGSEPLQHAEVGNSADVRRVTPLRHQN